METNQTFINQFVDDNYEAILDRLATKMQEASEIPVVDYNSLKHQAVLMQYVWEGVHQIQAVSPNSYLADALALVTAAVNRANAALQDIEDANAAICDAEELRALAETARANAENARAAAEELRAAAEQARASAENARALAETGRVNAETARANAETARSGWFNTFKATVESWYSSPDDGTGILQIWNAFKSSADTWMSLAQSAWNSFFGATAESEGGVRKIWSTWLASAQSAYQSLTNSMNAAETARADAETARANAETARANAETARANAETARDNAETTRGTNEQTRQTNEGTRQTSEGQRSAAEGLRALAELDREDAEDDREDAETARQSAYTTLMQNLQTLYQEMLSRNNHPAQFGQDGYIYQWDVTLEQYVRTEHFWKQFSSFHISKEFASISAMNAYDPTNLPQGEYALEVSDFVLIKSNPEDPDNSKLYSYSGENVDNDPDFERFHYLGDFSGAQGFQGKTPQLSIGTVLAGNPGTQPSVSLTADGQDSNGNPRFLVNFTIPRGADGRGISSLTQQTRSNVSGGENVWRATFSDGATADLIVLNGEQGANAGIGEATATVDSGVGTPSVTINTGGTNANRIFSFAFHNLKGVTFTPSVDANGNLSWTNDGGLTNPTSFNIISAIPLATQLQQGLMSAADKEKLDNSLPLASNQVSALTAANALAQDSGKTVFWGSQDNDGKWTLQKMSPEELQKLAYEYMKSSSILSEYASLLGVGAQKQQPQTGVYLEDVFGDLYSPSSWNSSKIINSIVVSTQGHCFRMAPIMLGMPIWIDKPDGYGNSIRFSTQDLSAFEQYPTPEQAETCFSGEKDTYSFNKMFSSKQNTVDMTYILGDAPVFCYNYKFNRGGNGYLMSAGEAKIIHNNITDIAAAYTAIGIPIGNPNLWTSTYCGVTSRGLQEFWASNRGNFSIGGYWSNIYNIIPLGRYY